MDSKTLVKLMAQYEIKKVMKIWGIERTEEKIYHLYRSMPYLKWYMLREYYNITNRSEQYKQMEK